MHRMYPKLDSDGRTGGRPEKGMKNRTRVFPLVQPFPKTTNTQIMTKRNG